MLRQQHTLVEPGVHVLSSLLAPVNHCLPLSSPESPDTDDSASADRYHRTNCRSPHQYLRAHRISDPDNDDIADPRTKQLLDDVECDHAAAVVDGGHELPSVHTDDDGDEDDDNDVTEVKQGDVRDDPRLTAKATLSPTMRRRLLEMLPDLMSAANYKRLVDEGHVVFPEEDEQIDVITNSPSLTEERQDGYENIADMASKHLSSQTYIEVTPQSSQDGGDEESKREEFMTSSFDPCLNSTLLFPEEGGHERPALYACHICEFLCQSKTLFDEHMNTRHYVHRCTMCRYSAKTAGRLQRHTADFHSGNRRQAAALGGATCRTSAARRRFKCRRCDYVTDNQASYWCHGRQHINPKDLFDCVACPFATRFKHHMMYHVLSHLDINPYSCTECGYPCKNKSMLKSHMKTHTNVYQYQCAFKGCSFVTKYCHAMNQHLHKYKNHKPAEMLNADGSLPSLRNIVLPEVNNFDRPLPAELSSTVDIESVTRLSDRRRRRRHPNPDDSVFEPGHVDDSKINLMKSTPSLVTPRTPVEVESPTSLPRPVVERDVKTLGLSPVKFPRDLYGTMSTWPMMWTAAAAAPHARHHQSLGAAATQAALASISSLYSIFYQPLLHLPPPVKPLRSFLPSFVWPTSASAWTTDAKQAESVPVERSGVDGVYKNGRPTASLPSTGSVSHTKYQEVYRSESLTHEVSGETPSHCPPCRTQPAVNDVQLERKSHFHDAYEDRYTMIDNRNRLTTHTTERVNSRYGIESGVQVVSKREPASSYAGFNGVEWVDIDTPVDLTKKRRTTLIRCNSSTSTEFEDRSILPPSKDAPNCRVLVDDVGAVADEMRKLQKSIVVESFSRERDYRRKLSAENGMSPDLRGRQVTARGHGEVTPVPIGDAVGAGDTDGSSYDRRRKTATSADDRGLRSLCQVLTPPTSDNLTLTVQPVARRLAAGFDGDNGVPRRPVYRDGSNEMPDFRMKLSSPECRRTLPSNDSVGWKTTSSSNLTQPTGNDDGRMLSLVGKHLESYLSDHELSNYGKANLNRVGDGGGGGGGGGKMTQRRDVPSWTPVKVKYECPCGIFYAHRDTYDAHMAFHYSDSEPFRCRLCDRRYSGAIEFYCHVMRYPHDMTSHHGH